MHTSRKLTHTLMALLALIVLASAAMAQVGPGIPVVGDGAALVGSMVSDQKAGSILFYTYYTSDPVNTNATNTRINVTNTNPTESAVIHVFFLAQGCSPADAFICLTPSQTMSFTTADYDPGSSGYIMMVAEDGDTPGLVGCPIAFNWLIGDEFIKIAGTTATNGFAANVGAEAVAALLPNGTVTSPGCDSGDSSAVLVFGAFLGVPGPYDFLGGVLAVDNMPTIAGGANRIRLALASPGGDFSRGSNPVGSLFGVLYDEAEQPFSFVFTGGPGCSAVIDLSATNPRILNGGLPVVIGPGRTGWMRFWKTPDPTLVLRTGFVDSAALLGIVLIASSNPAAGPDNFTGGHTLHKLTLQGSAIVIPLFPPAC